MSDIVLLDTSVYLNVLDIPGLNASREAVLEEFRLRLDNEDYFLLPLATIWETGNHISRLADGTLCRTCATKLVQDVQKALAGDVPYRPTHFPEREEFMLWLADFPTFAQRNKSPTKTGEGVSLADMSIIKEWERTCRQHSMSTVLIWSLDDDLKAYHQAAP